MRKLISAKTQQSQSLQSRATGFKLESKRLAKLRCCDQKSFNPKGKYITLQDLDAILEIEESVWKDPWDKVDFLRYLRPLANSCWAVMLGREITGFMLLSVHTSQVNLDNVCISPDFQDIGLGSFCIDWIKGEYLNGFRNKIVSFVREENLSSQFFLQSQGFLAELPIENNQFKMIFTKED